MSRLSPFSHQRRWLLRTCTISMALCALSAGERACLAQGVVGGVYIDPEGMLRGAATLKPGDRLDRARQIEGASTNVKAASSLRKISLRRLEAAVAALHAAGKPWPADLHCLAGLQSVRYVFFYPDRQDVVLAGPAGGWRQSDSGEILSEGNGRPVLHLDDLIVALRYAFGDNRGDAFLGCSIEPTEAGQKRATAYLQKLRRGIDPARAEPIFAGLEQETGPQDIKLYGVPGTSRAALTLVAADYRLKRIAMGHDPSPVREVINYLDLAARTPPRGAVPQPRWWFVGEFEAISHSADELAFELSGQAVHVQTGPSLKDEAAGKAPKPSRAAVQFAESFTRSFPELSAHVPVFGELQNFVGLAVVAQIIRRNSAGEAENDKPSAEGWEPRKLLDPQACPIPEYHVPARTPSLASYRQLAGKQWLVGVSGGVEIAPETFLAPAKLRAAPDGTLSGKQRAVAPPEQPEQWWWD